jgi:hypothetical protein
MSLIAHSSRPGSAPRGFVTTAARRPEIAGQSCGAHSVASSCPPVIHSLCQAVAALSLPVTPFACPEPRVHPRHGSCRQVTARIGNVDKWTAGVDNRDQLGKTVRTIVVSAGMIRGWVVGSGGLCVDWHSPGLAGIGVWWGDVDGISTACPPRNPRCDAATRRYPHAPQPLRQRRISPH